MAIPFKTLKPVETIDVAGFSIPKRGCLTVAEEVAVRDLGATLNKDLEGLTELQADVALKQRIVTILIQSRLDRDWTLEKTQATEWAIATEAGEATIEPDMEMLEALYLFFMQEQRRWKSDAELQAAIATSEGNGKKRLTGAKSSGSSSLPTQTKNGSEPKALATVQ